MKLFMSVLLVMFATVANANDSGLACTMSYSSSDALSTDTNSKSAWLTSGQQMQGSAVGVDSKGMWTTKPAHSISAKKNGSFWSVTIVDGSKKAVGSFSFTEKNGMKATMKTKAYMANENEDPAEYDKLEVSCYYTVFAG